MDSETMVVRLDWSYGYQGTNYGPGRAVRVPLGLAHALNLSAVDAEEDHAGGSDGSTLPPIRALVAHLQTMSTAAEVSALAATDTRVSAKPLYEARLAELSAEAE